jgi:2-polyprenyl-3-methyl-5-hydroxy-6-metoxy-1,4-benzoquinol methylase
MRSVTRWEQADVPRGHRYDERFRELEASGVDVHGEAAFVEALLRSDAPEPATGAAARVLDAGCGTGRVAVELAARGFDVVGVDLDPVMLDAARLKAPKIEWVLSDLAQLRLRREFDVAVLAGNVMLFVGPGTEEAVLSRVAAHVVPDGLLIAGFQLSGRLALADYDTAAQHAGLDLIARYSTWDGRPFAADDYAVSVHRRLAS